MTTTKRGPLWLVAAVALGGAYALVLVRAVQPDVGPVYEAYYLDGLLRRWAEPGELDTPLGETVSFAEDRAQIGAGWSHAEPWGGRWNDGRQAVLVFRPTAPDLPPVLTLRLDVEMAHLSRRTPRQRIRLEANGRALAEDALREPGGATVLLEVPTEAVVRDDLVVLRLSFPDATSPASAGTSNDSRALAIGVTGATLSSGPAA